MKTQPRELVVLSRARRAIAEAVTINDVKDIRDKAQLANAYAKKKQLAHEIIVEASAIKVEAERKLGQLLGEMELAKAAPGNQYTGKRVDRSHDTTGPVSLRELGLTKSESSRAQRIARLPQATFKKYVNDNVKAGREPTTAGALRLARDMEVAESVSVEQPNVAGVVTDLDELIQQGAKFKTLYLDPPWQYDDHHARGGSAWHYESMSLEDIRALPVEQLAEENAHLHLWTTSSFLPDALSLIEHWNFRYVSGAVWCKPSIGVGRYYRCSHEYLLLGVKGSLPFRDKSQRSWVEAERGKHSEKPEVFREIVEACSYPPFIELFSRKPPVNSDWTVYGNQISSPSTATKGG